MKTIEELAREAGFNVVMGTRGWRIDERSWFHNGGCAAAGPGYEPPQVLDRLERFAALIRAQALEEAAVIADDFYDGLFIAESIRDAGSKPPG